MIRNLLVLLNLTINFLLEKKYLTRDCLTQISIKNFLQK